MQKLLVPRAKDLDATTNRGMGPSIPGHTGAYRKKKGAVSQPAYLPDGSR